MGVIRRLSVAAVVLALHAQGAGTGLADEGMWPLDGPMPKGMKERYGFEPTPAWLDHLRKSCVRFSTGGSGAFVSADGLVLTNHHVGANELAKLGTPERDLLATGFLARSRAEELRCKELELIALWSTEDVTARILAAGAKAKTSAEAETARRAEAAKVEQEAAASTRLHCEVVAFYGGARHVLHRYKRWTDVRLVMAPEQAAAFFGGDADNFEYPRFDLDVCFFRVYEDGRPLKPEHHLAWSAAGTKDGELTLVAGHPWRTQRLHTADHLRFLRDVDLPLALHRAWRREVKLSGFSARSDENARMAMTDLFDVQNGRKAQTGLLAGLHDPALLSRKEADEARLRAAVAADAARREAWGDPWGRISRALAAYRAFHRRHLLLGEWQGLRGSRLFGVASRIVRLVDERSKPNAERLREYRESEVDSLLREVLSDARVHAALEVEELANALSALAEDLGADDPSVARALSGKSPRARAEALVKGTSLFDVASRKALVEGGQKAVAASKDALVRFAADLDPESRALRKRHDDEVRSVENEEYAKVAAARFAVEGAAAYPDATYTLRLSYGPVRGYREDGREVAPFTTLGGAYLREAERKGVPPFALPSRWRERKDRLALDTPYNFVSTADIIGGNSGSPVVNAAGEVVGVVFDGNLQGLVLDLVYTEEQARCVSVDARAVIECLKVLYDAQDLVDEILR